MNKQNKRETVPQIREKADGCQRGGQWGMRIENKNKSKLSWIVTMLNVNGSRQSPNSVSPQMKAS